MDVSAFYAVVWRSAFLLGGAAGVVGIVKLAPILLQTHLRTPARLLLVVGVPLYALIAIIAALPELRTIVVTDLTSLQVEAILFCLLVLLGAQAAWTAARSPSQDQDDARTGLTDR